ncbi:MAG: glycosyltransferase [Bacteroidales bacterium]|jgi:dolichol-phosphate mannosyltransferase
MKLYFLIPVFNESQNIEHLYNNLIKAVGNYEKFYVFVDDYSTDNTIDMLNNFFKSNFIVIRKEKNCGPGDSFNKGFEWILNDSKNENDLIVTLEGDNTSDLNILPNMLTISNLKYNLVLASVYAQGGGFGKTSFFRKIISLIANMLFRSFFNIKVLTLSSFYRVYHISLIKKIKERYGVIIKENGFISMLEILIKAIRVNASIIEVPMLLKSENRKGKSKMKIFKNTLNYIRFLFFNKF